MTKIFLLIQHYCGSHQVFELLLVPEDLIGSVIHWKTLLGERRDYSLIFRNCANAQVLFSGATVCSLSDWDRQVCVWLCYHLWLHFASASAGWAFLPVSLLQLMMNYKRPCSAREYRCFHTHTSSLSYWMALHREKRYRACDTVDGKWGLIMQTQWENRG